MTYRVSGTIDECSDYNKAGLKFDNFYPFSSVGINTTGEHSIEIESDDTDFSVTPIAGDGVTLVVGTFKVEAI